MRFPYDGRRAPSATGEASCARAVRTVPLLLAGAILAASCSSPARNAPGAPKEAVPVLAGTVVRKDVPVEIGAVGTVEALSTVSVRAQVGGEVVGVHFKEGQDVRKGDLLFTLDRRPYEAALHQAEATLARDTAELENARAEEKRYAELVQKEYVTAQQFDDARTRVASLEATVRSDGAAVEDARVQLGYCTIRSPIEGRAGRLVVHLGNVVKANDDTPFVVINQIEPIAVAFSVPQQSLPDIRGRAAEGRLEVRAVRGPGGSDDATGELRFIDNQVDLSTGTILLKATFPNRDASLWPGEFVRVRLVLAHRAGALVVPAGAIQAGQQGSYAFVIGAGDTVESRTVVPGPTLGGETVVEKGLAEGERVVTDGQLRLVPGAKVEIRREVSESAGTAR